MGVLRQPPSKEKGMILGGTSRSPEDVQALHELGLQLAELPILDFWI